jgi:hypothetical protein
MQIARLSPVLFISKCGRCDAISFSETERAAIDVEREHRCIEPERRPRWDDDFDTMEIMAKTDFAFLPAEQWN